ncbi:unnamed protein product [Amoebophrya sp. A25]|nr:unnamed protein product [Amoebophrya sp. A25]|eukprot:GSA25T00021767001.1
MVRPTSLPSARRPFLFAKSSDGDHTDTDTYLHDRGQGSTQGATFVPPRPRYGPPSKPPGRGEGSSATGSSDTRRRQELEGSSATSSETGRRHLVVLEEDHDVGVTSSGLLGGSRGFQVLEQEQDASSSSSQFDGPLFGEEVVRAKLEREESRSDHSGSPGAGVGVVPPVGGQDRQRTIKMKRPHPGSAEDEDSTTSRVVTSTSPPVTPSFPVQRATPAPPRPQVFEGPPAKTSVKRQRTSTSEQRTPGGGGVAPQKILSSTSTKNKKVVQFPTTRDEEAQVLHYQPHHRGSTSSNNSSLHDQAFSSTTTTSTGAGKKSRSSKHRGFERQGPGPVLEKRRPDEPIEQPMEVQVDESSLGSRSREAGPRRSVREASDVDHREQASPGGLLEHAQSLRASRPGEGTFTEALLSAREQREESLRQEQEQKLRRRRSSKQMKKEDKLRKREEEEDERFRRQEQDIRRRQEEQSRLLKQQEEEAKRLTEQQESIRRRQEEQDRLLREQEEEAKRLHQQKEEIRRRQEEHEKLLKEQQEEEDNLLRQQEEEKKRLELQMKQKEHEKLLKEQQERRDLQPTFHIVEDVDIAVAEEDATLTEAEELLQRERGTTEAEQPPKQRVDLREDANMQLVLEKDVEMKMSNSNDPDREEQEVAQLHQQADDEMKVELEQEQQAFALSADEMQNESEPGGDSEYILIPDESSTRKNKKLGRQQPSGEGEAAPEAEAPPLVEGGDDDVHLVEGEGQGAAGDLLDLADLSGARRMRPRRQMEAEASSSSGSSDGGSDDDGDIPQGKPAEKIPLKDRLAKDSAPQQRMTVVRAGEKPLATPSQPSEVKQFVPQGEFKKGWAWYVDFFGKQLAAQLRQDQAESGRAYQASAAARNAHARGAAQVADFLRDQRAKDSSSARARRMRELRKKDRHAGAKNWSMVKARIDANKAEKIAAREGGPLRKHASAALRLLSKRKDGLGISSEEAKKMASEESNKFFQGVSLFSLAPPKTLTGMQVKSPQEGDETQQEEEQVATGGAPVAAVTKVPAPQLLPHLDHRLLKINEYLDPPTQRRIDGTRRPEEGAMAPIARTVTLDPTAKMEWIEAFREQGHETTLAELDVVHGFRRLAARHFQEFRRQVYTRVSGYTAHDAARERQRNYLEDEFGLKDETTMFMKQATAGAGDVGGELKSGGDPKSGLASTSTSSFKGLGSAEVAPRSGESEFSNSIVPRIGIADKDYVSNSEVLALAKRFLKGTYVGSGPAEILDAAAGDEKNKDALGPRGPSEKEKKLYHWMRTGRLKQKQGVTKTAKDLADQLFVTPTTRDNYKVDPRSAERDAREVIQRRFTRREAKAMAGRAKRGHEGEQAPVGGDQDPISSVLQICVEYGPIGGTWLPRPVIAEPWDSSDDEDFIKKVLAKTGAGDEKVMKQHRNNERKRELLARQKASMLDLKELRKRVALERDPNARGRADLDPAKARTQALMALRKGSKKIRRGILQPTPEDSEEEMDVPLEDRKQEEVLRELERTAKEREREAELGDAFDGGEKAIAHQVHTVGIRKIQLLQELKKFRPREVAKYVARNRHIITRDEDVVSTASSSEAFSSDSVSAASEKELMQVRKDLGFDPVAKARDLRKDGREIKATSPTGQVIQDFVGKVERDQRFDMAAAQKRLEEDRTRVDKYKLERDVEKAQREVNSKLRRKGALQTAAPDDMGELKMLSPDRTNVEHERGPVGYAEFLAPELADDFITTVMRGALKVAEYEPVDLTALKDAGLAAAEAKLRAQAEENERQGVKLADFGPVLAAKGLADKISEGQFGTGADLFDFKGIDDKYMLAADIERKEIFIPDAGPVKRNMDYLAQIKGLEEQYMNEPVLLDKKLREDLDELARAEAYLKPKGSDEMYMMDAPLLDRFEGALTDVRLVDRAGAGFGQYLPEVLRDEVLAMMRPLDVVDDANQIKPSDIAPAPDSQLTKMRPEDLYPFADELFRDFGPRQGADLARRLELDTSLKRTSFVTGAQPERLEGGLFLDYAGQGANLAVNNEGLDQHLAGRMSFVTGMQPLDRETGEFINYAQGGAGLTVGTEVSDLPIRFSQVAGMQPEQMPTGYFLTQDRRDLGYQLDEAMAARMSIGTSMHPELLPTGYMLQKTRAGAGMVPDMQEEMDAALGDTRVDFVPGAQPLDYRAKLDRGREGLGLAEYLPEAARTSFVTGMQFDERGLLDGGATSGGAGPADRVEYLPEAARTSVIGGLDGITPHIEAGGTQRGHGPADIAGYLPEYGQALPEMTDVQMRPQIVETLRERADKAHLGGPSAATRGGIDTLKDYKGLNEEELLHMENLRGDGDDVRDRLGAAGFAGGDRGRLLRTLEKYQGLKEQELLHPLVPPEFDEAAMEAARMQHMWGMGELGGELPLDIRPYLADKDALIGSPQQQLIMAAGRQRGGIL